MSSFSRLSKYSGPLPVSTTGQEEKKSPSNDSSSLAGVISQSIPPEHQSSSACQFAASHLNPSSSECYETKTAENGDKDFPKIYDLPKKLLGKISSFLSITDLQAAVCASKKMNESVIAGLNDNGTYSIKHFINKLIQKLDEKKYPEQKKQLVEIEKNLTLPNSKNLKELQDYCLDVKEQLIKIIKTLEQTTANGLKDPKKLPSFLEDFFDLVEFGRNIDNALLIPSDIGRICELSAISLDLSDARHFDRAILATSLIPDGLIRTKTLSKILDNLAYTDQFERFIHLPSLILDHHVRGRMFLEISIDLTNKGDSDRAIKFALLIPNDDERWSALSEISKYLANEGDFDRAIHVTSLIANDFERRRALSEISISLANRSNFNGAIYFTSLINETCFPKTEALLAICNNLREIGDFGGAIEVALSIPSDFDRTNMLMSCSADLSLAGRFAEAAHVQSLISDKKDALEASKEKTEISSEEKKD